MSIAGIVLLIVLFWIVNTFVGPPWKTLLNGLLCLAVLLCILWILGSYGYLGGFDLPHGHHWRR